MKFTLCLATLLASSLPALAGSQMISVSFTESAPKDRFTLTNTGDCAITGAFRLDLASSVGKLIFDTTSAGAGVEVFQPFEVTKGTEFLENLPSITDGDQSAILALKDFASGQTVTFTIDVDDQLANSELGQIRVSGSEIEGAAAGFVGSSGKTAVFGKDAKAITNGPACPA